MTTRRDPRGGGRGCARAGFSLLEVLAAVAIFGIVFTALAGTAIHWIAAEGESARRLRASLLADDVVNEIETQLELGTAPPIGEEEREAEDYTVRIQVTPFELPFELVNEEAPRGQAIPSLLTPAERPEESLLRTVQVQVAWIEGADERSVSRTTYGFDLAGAQQVLSQLPGPDGAEGFEEQPPTRGDDEGGVPNTDELEE